MKPFLQAALTAAQAAAVDIMAYYRGDFEIELKPDQTPVTVADRRAEEIISGILLDAFPDHGFYGEFCSMRSRIMVSMEKRAARNRRTQTTCGWSIPLTAPRVLLADTACSPRRSP